MGELEYCIMLSATWYFETMSMVPKCPGLAGQRVTRGIRWFQRDYCFVLLKRCKKAHFSASTTTEDFRQTYALRGVRMPKCRSGKSTAQAIWSVCAQSQPTCPCTVWYSTWHCFTPNVRLFQAHVRRGCTNVMIGAVFKLDLEQRVL